MAKKTYNELEQENKALKAAVGEAQSKDNAGGAKFLFFVESNTKKKYALPYGSFSLERESDRISIKMLNSSRDYSAKEISFINHYDVASALDAPVS